MTDNTNQPIRTARLTSGRDIVNSLPRLSDVCVTFIATSGKVLCYYFVKVSTWHHTRELPYWCGGCQSSEIQRRKPFTLFSKCYTSSTSIILGNLNNICVTCLLTQQCTDYKGFLIQTEMSLPSPDKSTTASSFLPRQRSSI